MHTQSILEKLNSTEGLHHAISIPPSLKKEIQVREDKENEGVLECLKRDITIVLFHDSTFRDPPTPITETRNGKIFFPPVPFPEVQEKDVVSSSPSAKVDSYIRKALYQHTDFSNEDASLIVGFNR